MRARGPKYGAPIIDTGELPVTSVKLIAGRWHVLRGDVSVKSFADQAEATGWGRRVFEGTAEQYERDQ